MFLLRLIWVFVRALFANRADLVAENLALPLASVDPARKHQRDNLPWRAPRVRLHGCHVSSNDDRRLYGGASSKH